MSRSLLLISFLLCASCSSITSPTDTVQIRVENESSLRFDQVIIVFPAQQEEYGSVLPHRRSGYREVSQAYRYAYVKVHAGGQELVLQPLDYVGETPLEAGRYTYVLGVDAAQQSLSLALRKDR